MEETVLLASEIFVKEVSNISDNLTPKYLRPAIVKAQEVKLRQVVGDSLLDKLKAVAVRANAGGQTPEDALYIQVIRKARYVITYYAMADVLPRVSYKIGNSGMSVTDNETTRQASLEEVAWVRDNYIADGDTATRDLQMFLLQNRDSLPELAEAECYRIKAHLSSFASCGIVLGGARGKKGGVL